MTSSGLGCRHRTSARLRHRRRQHEQGAVAERLVLRSAAPAQGKALTRCAFAPVLDVEIEPLDLIGTVSCDPNPRSLDVGRSGLAGGAPVVYHAIGRAVRASLAREPDP